MKGLLVSIMAVSLLGASWVSVAATASAPAQCPKSQKAAPAKHKQSTTKTADAAGDQEKRDKG